MAKQKSYPNYLYVTIENQGEEDQYFDATDDIDGQAKIGETVKVARYRLDEIAIVSAIIEHKVVK